MNDKFLVMNTAEIPDSFEKGVSCILRNYSTALIRCHINNEGIGVATLIGSGTFAIIGNKSGILTAQHVARELSHQDALGLTLREDIQGRPYLCKHLTFIDVAIPEHESLGPDLSFIVIPNVYLGTIRAYKSFYPIMAYQDNYMKCFPESICDLWFVYGTIGERTTEEIPEKGFDTVIGYHGFCGMTNAEKSYSVGSYDFIESRADYGELDTPESFGGMSGGGLWRVPLFTADPGKIKAKDYLLAGVIFYQTELNDNVRFIRSHGPRSIYEMVLNKVQENES